MSNIYIQEPPALGKVLLKTTVGDIDLELWTKEAPKACRNFIQLCMEGYYNGTIFHRVVPDFIVQGGDPKGDGTGGESIYGAPFKDEFHTRLRFNRRGLVAMANGGKDDNASQFFFTLNATPELQNKHTIFAKVTGETVFNMLKLAEGETDIEDRPMYPHKITDSQILVNPFDDIVPRVVEKQKDEPIDKKKKKEKGVKNFGLLSFGMEAEEEEDQFTEFRGKPKSTHDVLDDPKLSKLTSIDLENGDDVSNEFKEDSENTEAAVANIRGKLLTKKDKNADKKPEEEESKEVKSDEEIEEYYLGKDKKEARKKQAEEIRKQIKDLKREMSSKKNQIDELVSDKKSSEKKKAIENNELVEQFENEQKKYKKKMEELPKKGASRKKRSPLQQSNKKPWIKKLYENTGIYPDNYTDKRFLQEMRKNVNVYNVTFFQCFLGSCRVTQKLSTCVLFSVIFTYLYNEWTSPQFVFGASSVINFLGYIFFLTVNKRKIEEHKKDSETVGKNSNVEEFKTDVKKHVSPNVNQNFEDIRADNLLSSYMERYTKRSTKKRHRLYSFDGNSISDKSIHLKVNNSFTKFVFDDLKMVLIYLVFGYIFSPILHTLTDTVSTDTIYATTIFMMIIHLIFSDYGISVAVVSNSFSINSIFFGSTCLASRLSTPFCAFVLLTVSVQAFVLSPILIKVMWNTNFAIFVFGATTLVTFISLWNVSRTMFFFFLFAVIFLNVYCPFLFIRWQKYKDNIYGPWDEAVVHDSDDISECIGVR